MFNIKKNKIKYNIKNISDIDKKLIKRLLRENFYKNAKWYIYAIISMFFIAISTAASAWIMHDVVNQIVHGNSYFLILIVALTVAIIFIIKGLSNFFQIFFLSKAGNKIVADQQRKIYNKIIQQGISFYQNYSSSDLLIRVTHNANAARNIIDTIITIICRDCLSIIGLFIVMLIQNFVFSIIAIVVGPIAFIIVRKILKRIRKLVEKEVLSMSTIIKFMQETTFGIRVVKIFSLEELMKCRMYNAIKDVEKRANSIAILEAIANPIMETLAGIAIAIIIIFSGNIADQKIGSEGDIMSFITALLLAYEPAKRLASARIKIESGIIAVRMMFDIIDHPISIVEKNNSKKLPYGVPDIMFNNVSFYYIKNNYVLKNINMIFPAGKMTAIIGPSGSGKSTIINLIMRLYDINHGSIKIDKYNIKDITFKSLRDKISYVEQNTFLFEGSILYNISLGNSHANKEDIINASKAANAHNFIINLKNGYDTNVGDNGINLSSGEKQRISIARALLKNSDILILDEITSSIDLESEKLICKALDRLSKNKTTIMIAHRLSTISKADKIIVIKQGKVIEEGTKKHLFNKKNGFYRNLCNLHFQKLNL